MSHEKRHSHFVLFTTTEYIISTKLTHMLFTFGYARTTFSITESCQPEKKGFDRSTVSNLYQKVIVILNNNLSYFVFKYNLTQIIHISFKNNTKNNTIFYYLPIKISVGELFVAIANAYGSCMEACWKINNFAIAEKSLGLVQRWVQDVFSLSVTVFL